MKSFKGIQAGIFAAAMLSAAGANANLLSNGSFETPDINSGWGVYSSIDGWETAWGNGIEIQTSGTVVNAQDGDQYVELDSHGGNSNSAMVQEITGLTVGADYTLSFWYQPRTSQGAFNFNDNGIDVYWGNPAEQIDSISNEFRVADTDWTEYVYTLTATDENMILGFVADGLENTLGGFIDNVSLTSVPEPASIAMFGLGLAALGLSRRKEAK